MKNAPRNKPSKKQQTLYPRQFFFKCWLPTPLRGWAGFTRSLFQSLSSIGPSWEKNKSPPIAPGVAPSLNFYQSLINSWQLFESFYNYLLDSWQTFKLFSTKWKPKRKKERFQYKYSNMNTCSPRRDACYIEIKNKQAQPPDMAPLACERAPFIRALPGQPHRSIKI